MSYNMEYRSRLYIYLTVFLLCTLGLYNSCAGGNSCHCPLHWEEFGNYCYFFIIYRDTYQAATQTCQRLSYGTRTARVTSIWSDEENEFIDDYMVRFGVDRAIWIDLVYNGTEFIWQDGPPLDFTNWENLHSAANVTKECVVREKGNNKWSTRDCFEIMGIMCKMKIRPWLIP